MKQRLTLAWVLALAVWDVAAAGDGMTLGIHVHEPVHIEAAARTGYSAIRLWDTGTDWASLKPQPDLWRLDRVEAYLAASEKTHLKVLWTIGNTPRWASARPNEKCAYELGCAAEPANIEDWRRYVRTVATTFRGRIECYEPWNEVSFPTDPAFKQPGVGGDPAQFFTGSVDAMVTLARVAYEEIKRADPQACVLSPSFHSSGNWAEKLDRFLAAGGGRYLDVVSQHFYFGEEPEKAVPIIRAMRQVLAKHGLDHKPIWNTEIGFPFEAKASQWPSLSLEDLVYALTLRTYLLNASEGVPRVYWYAWDNKGMGFFKPETNLDFGSAAASAAVHLFDGFEAANCESNGRLWQCRVSSGGRRLKVVWVAGKNAKPIPIAFDRDATRWGRIRESLPAGRQIVLDGRPVIIEDE
ncbi:MAG: hypothetical protein K0M66_05365 [Thiobacillus sp.]|nr:hypothetical protein [Thiobacillus sp.]